MKSIVPIEVGTNNMNLWCNSSYLQSLTFVVQALVIGWQRDSISSDGDQQCNLK